MHHFEPLSIITVILSGIIVGFFYLSRAHTFVGFLVDSWKSALYHLIITSSAFFIPLAIVETHMHIFFESSDSIEEIVEHFILWFLFIIFYWIALYITVWRTRKRG